MSETIYPVRKEIPSREILPKRFHPEERKKEAEEPDRNLEPPQEEGKGIYVDILV
jgi:hypothetical protein